MDLDVPTTRDGSRWSWRRAVPRSSTNLDGPGVAILRERRPAS